MSKENGSNKAFDGSWLRRATDGESSFDDEFLQRNYRLCYTLRLCSKAPLQSEHVRLALVHLYRKCPNLHFCFGYRDGERWIRNPTNPEIDFEVLDGKDVKEVVESLLDYRYSSETGPLFCARLMRNSNDIPAVGEDLDTKPPHVSYVLIGLHHSVGDGTTNSHTMGFFISLLNDVISGKPINDDETLGEFIDDRYMEEVLEETREILRADPELDAKLGHEIASFEKNTSYLASCFPKSNGVKETRIIEHIFDRDTTGRFLQKCREKGITFNSGFSAAASVAITDLLKDKGIIHESYKINFFADNNFRRYWKTSLPKALGMHVGHCLLVSTNIPQNLGTDYWEYARSLHEHIWNDLKSKKTLLLEAHVSLQSKVKPPSISLEKTHQMCAEFFITNMGDVTSIVSKGSDDVDITHILRNSSIHEYSKCLLHILCQTFQGRFTMTFTYDPSAIQKETVQKFCNLIVKRISSV